MRKYPDFDYIDFLFFLFTGSELQWRIKEYDKGDRQAGIEIEKFKRWSL